MASSASVAGNPDRTLAGSTYSAAGPRRTARFPSVTLIGAGSRSLVTRAVVAVISPISVAVVRRIAIAVVRRIAIAVVRRITVAVVGTIPGAVIRIRIIGPRKCASDERAYGEAAKRWAPAPPPRIRRGGRGNSRDRDSRRCESGKRFPHGVYLDLRTAVSKRGLSRNVPQE